ncbi:olfactory receptor 4C6-like [Bolinopsis microptera]|uniref:olfactory receptor 4C6-like n=1 Tax=Bolinopsis microptera TaxID=2820187 RepID=UPI003079926F
MVLMPLTIDRFLAVITPLKHKNWMTQRVMFLMIGAWWVPAMCSALYPLTKYHIGPSAMTYQIEYHRCTLDDHDTGIAEAVIFYFTPIITLITLYSIMLVNIIKQQTRCKKLLLTSLSICTVGVLIAIPQTLLYINLHMGYEVAQFFTVTLFYISPLCDSFIYYCVNPMVQQMLPESGIGQTVRRFSQSITNLNLNVRLSFTFLPSADEISESPGTPTSVRSFAGRLSPSICYRHPGNSYRFQRISDIERGVGISYTHSRVSVLSI